MTRSVFKGPFIDVSVFKALRKVQNNSVVRNKSLSQAPIQIWSRRSVILPNCVNLIFRVHNGRDFIRLVVTEEMIGHRFGEFALTRKKPKHPSLTASSKKSSK